MILCRYITSVFFFNRDCWAETMFLNLCLSATGIFFCLAVANFRLISSIFFWAVSWYTSHFSRLRPLFLRVPGSVPAEISWLCLPPMAPPPSLSLLGFGRASFYFSYAFEVRLLAGVGVGVAYGAAAFLLYLMPPPAVVAAAAWAVVSFPAVTALACALAGSPIFTGDRFVWLRNASKSFCAFPLSRSLIWAVLL